MTPIARSRRTLFALLLSLLLGAGANVGATEAPAVDSVARLTRILEMIRSRYVEPVDDGKLFAEAVNGIMKGLDTHSAYMDTDTYRRVLQETQGRYGGLGIEVRKDGDALRVVSIFDDTPAQRAGLLADDLITAVNERSFGGLNLEQSVSMVRGEPNTTLLLTLSRSGEPGRRRLALDREQIQGRSVRAGMIGESFLYVRLTEFHRHSAEEMAMRMERLHESSPSGIGGVVLDLRDNPGGTLNSAVAVASAFLPVDALVVYTNGMAPESKLKFLARKDDYLRGASEDYLDRVPAEIKRAPLVVLVNRGSASSSEIVAAALQDHGRATIVGTRTYGKGSIQVILPLGDGTALKLTTSRYYTPKGRVIEKQGIAPDQLVEQDPIEGPDAVSHLVALGRLESQRNLRGPMTRVVCAVRTPPSHPAATDEALSADSNALSDVVDCQLARALQILEEVKVAGSR